MKHFIWPIVCLGVLSVSAQAPRKLVLTPVRTTLVTGESLNLTLSESDDKGKPLESGGAAYTRVINWSLNGAAPGEESEVYGALHRTLDLSKCTYVAPAGIPPVNPVAVSVRTSVPGSAEVDILVCTITIVKRIYKLTGDFEMTGPEGMHYKLHGEALVKLQGYNDDTYGLVPLDGTKNMQLNVIEAGIPGKLTFIGPRTYNSPFVLNIGSMGVDGKAVGQAKISIESLSPMDNMARIQGETYQTPASTVTLYNHITQMFAGVFMKTTMATNKENGAIAQADLVWIQRLRANKDNPAYFHSPQGQADLQSMQKFSQEHGVSLANLYNGGAAPVSSGTTPKDSASQAFVSGIKGTQTNPFGAVDMAAGNPTVAGGLLHFDGLFDPNAGSTFDVIANESNQELHGTIRFRIDKVK